jgi:DNA polymerase
MNLITVDFESYYSKEFGFSKLTTEEYVRDDRFEVIGVGIKENDEETQWFSGDHNAIQAALDKYNWKDSFVLAHNTAFDGAILSWLFGVTPKGWLDTLSMARAIHGVSVGGSLAKLAEHYNVGVKGEEVINALGLRRQDFSAAQLARYGEYCKNDVDLCSDIFQLMMDADFPTQELKVIDATLRMFIEPSLELDLPLLEQHLEEVKARKERLLEAAKADKDTLMSNDKFAELLRALKVDPPRKISATTGKEAWAFAKTDEAFKELAKHPDPRVQVLVSARLGNKTTLEETRTQRFIDIAKRGKLPVPLKYYAAHTGRWGGDDKVNLQNLPSRGDNAGKLKMAIRAPKGYVMIDSDSSQIEARTLAWLAGQDDLVEAFAKGEDVYKIMASAIYNKPVEDISKDERFVGKTTILGAGYGMGGEKFQAQLKTFNVDIPLDECKRIIDVYRRTYAQIPQLWQAANSSLESMILKRAASVGRKGVLQFDAEGCGFILPNGLPLRYAELRKVSDAQGRAHYEYKTRMGFTKVYGGKVVENLCQALARCVIAEQMLKIGKRYKTVLTVHDAVACIAPKEEADVAQAYVEDCMRWTPAWATGLPLNCESGVAESYGEC